MSGCLLADYEIGQWKEHGRRSCRRTVALVKTIVTTNMADAIAKKYGVREIEVLTGFKYIGRADSGSLRTTGQGNLSVRL